MSKIFRLLETKNEAEHGVEYDVVWRCYSCGTTSEKGTFRTVRTWTDYGYEYECVCNTCESDLTAEDGEGEPVCDGCGGYGWYCDECRVALCGECWQWYETPEGEPDEYEHPGECPNPGPLRSR